MLYLQNIILFIYLIFYIVNINFRFIDIVFLIFMYLNRYIKNREGFDFENGLLLEIIERFCIIFNEVI